MRATAADMGDVPASADRGADNFRHSGERAKDATERARRFKTAPARDKVKDAGRDAADKARDVGQDIKRKVD